MDYLILQVEEKQLLAAQFRLSGNSSELVGATMFELIANTPVDDALSLLIPVPNDLVRQAKRHK